MDTIIPLRPRHQQMAANLLARRRFLEELTQTNERAIQDLLDTYGVEGKVRLDPIAGTITQAADEPTPGA